MREGSRPRCMLAIFGENMRVSGDRRGDAVGFPLSTKAAMQGTPTSRKSGSNTPYRPITMSAARRWRIAVAPRRCARGPPGVTARMLRQDGFARASGAGAQGQAHDRAVHRFRAAGSLYRPDEGGAASNGIGGPDYRPLRQSQGIGVTCWRLMRI